MRLTFDQPVARQLPIHDCRERIFPDRVEGNLARLEIPPELPAPEIISDLFVATFRVHELEPAVTVDVAEAWEMEYMQMQLSAILTPDFRVHGGTVVANFEAVDFH